MTSCKLVNFSRRTLLLEISKDLHPGNKMLDGIKYKATMGTVTKGNCLVL